MRSIEHNAPEQQNLSLKAAQHAPGGVEAKCNLMAKVNLQLSQVKWGKVVTSKDTFPIFSSCPPPTIPAQPTPLPIPPAPPWGQL